MYIVTIQSIKLENQGVPDKTKMIKWDGKGKGRISVPICYSVVEVVK